MEHWSASRFMCWDQCPAEFYARYIAGHPEEPTEAMLFGSAIHQGLEAHYLGGFGDLVFRQQWKAYVAEALGGQADPKLTGVGLDLLEEVFALELEGQPEWGFSLPTETSWGAPTVGYVDLVGDGGRTLYDFKTTTGTWSAARAERELWQPSLYTLAANLAFDVWPITFRYVVLNKARRSVDVFETHRTHEQLWEAEDRAATIAKRVEDSDFACHGQHGLCPECGARWEHGHVCDLSVTPPRIRLGGNV